MPRAFHSDAISYDHDPESRRSVVRFNLWKCELEHDDLVNNDQAIALDPDGWVRLHLTDEDAITLYEALQSHLWGYVSEMRQAEYAVGSRQSLAAYIGDWRQERENDMDAYLPTDPKSHGYHDRMVDVWDNREK